MPSKAYFKQFKHGVQIYILYYKNTSKKHLYKLNLKTNSFYYSVL